MVEARGQVRRHVALRNKGDRRGEIAYGSHPWVRGTGHVEHALRMLLDWGFREKDLATVIWLANVGNWASRRVAWKLGFAFEGTLRQWLSHRGELRDAWVGTLLSGDPREPQGRWIDDAVLERGGVRLRPFREDDAPRVVEACREERTTRWLAELPAPYTEDDALSFIHGRTGLRASGRGLSWAVADPATDALLGSVGLFDVTDDLAFGEVGYWTHPEARGRGVMTAAVGLVVGARLRSARAAPGQGLRRPRQPRVPPRARGQRPRSSTGWSVWGRSSPRAGSMPCCTTSCVRSGHAGRRH